MYRFTPLLFFFLLAGCTATPSVVTIVTINDDSEKDWEVVNPDQLTPEFLSDWEEVDESMESDPTPEEEVSPADSQQSETLPNMPGRNPVPEIPTFTEKEAADSDVVEDRLVEYIRTLREFIFALHAEMDEFEQQLLEQDIE